MADQTRTMLGWFEYLDDPKKEFDRTDFMMLMLFHIRQHVAKMSTLAQEQRDGAEHIEAMLGSLDEYMTGASAEYRQIADRRALASAPALEGARPAEVAMR